MSLAECLEEVEKLNTRIEAREQQLKDIFRDHPDIERPEIDPDDPGKGPEPCRDNEWEARNQQLIDKISDLQKELEEAKAAKKPTTDQGTQADSDDLVHTNYAHCMTELKGSLDAIRSAPRDCYDSNGELLRRPGNNRPPKTEKTLSEQLSDCNSELRKHNEQETGCGAKTQKLTEQLKQCQTDNAKIQDKTKTDMEQLCQEQLADQAKKLTAEHQGRVNELKGELDLKETYCHEDSGKSPKGKGKGPVLRLSKRQADDEEVLEEDAEEVVEDTDEGSSDEDQAEPDNDSTSDAEPSAEEVPSPDDDQATGNSSLPSSATTSFGVTTTRQPNATSSLTNVSSASLSSWTSNAHLDRLPSSKKQCQAALDKKLQEQEKFWRGEVDIWKAQSKTSDDRAVSIGEKCAASRASEQKVAEFHEKCENSCHKKPHWFVCAGTFFDKKGCKRPKWCKACKWV